ncbi:hypothetical protein [Rhizobium leguminosarum]|uniref:hypothetical protein n=1 Tax=Rhizobium leguminosarum TaxID=384 RepID=UPI001FF02B72|nr:hypothetical protein [Rhizobium leguminosarum]
MSDDRFQLWLGLCLMGSFCAYNWYWYIRLVIFYRKNGFDFSKDFEQNDYFVNYRFFEKPKAKFFFAMPFAVAVSSFITLGFALGLMRVIELCMGCGRYGLGN